MLEAVKHLSSFSTLFQAQSESALHMGERSPSVRPASSGVLSSCAVLGWKGPTKGRQALTPPSWTLIQTACTWIPCWRSCCRALATLPFLLAAPPQSWGCAGRHSKASFDSKHGLQVLPHAARCDKDTRQKPKLEKKQSRGLQGQSGCCLWCHCDLHQSRWSGLTVVHASYQDRMISLKFNGLAVIMWSNVSFFSSVLIWLLTSFLTRIRRICIGRK